VEVAWRSSRQRSGREAPHREREENDGCRHDPTPRNRVLSRNPPGEARSPLTSGNAFTPLKRFYPKPEQQQANPLESLPPAHAFATFNRVRLSRSGHSRGPERSVATESTRTHLDESSGAKVYLASFVHGTWERS
jgi:hypothetical protein